MSLFIFLVLYAGLMALLFMGAGRLVRHGVTWRTLTRTFARHGVCQACLLETRHVRHGYGVNGLRWKGHDCACHGWQCVSCLEVVEVDGPCCL